MIGKLTNTIRFQPHSPDCLVHGRWLPRGPLDDLDDDRHGPPEPCDCWRASFFREADALNAEIEDLMDQRDKRDDANFALCAKNKELQAIIALLIRT